MNEQDYYIGKMANQDLAFFVENPTKETPIDIGPTKDVLPIEGDIYPPGKLIAIPYTGVVLDKQSGEPIPGASVYLYSAGSPIAGQATNSKGEFYLTTDIDGNQINISHASYKPSTVKAAIYRNENFYIAELERDEKELPPVKLPSGTSGNNNMWLLLLLAGAVLAVNSDKKKVGKIDMSTLLLIGAGGAMLLGFDTIKKLMESIGLWKSKDEKDFDENTSNPDSMWSPLFWTKGGTNTLILTNSFCNWLYDEIYDSFGVFNDDEARIYAAFKQLKTQSQLSYFSYWVQQNKGTDLLEWLIGGKYGPVGDHLSVSEIKVITDYVSKLPKYRL